MCVVAQSLFVAGNVYCLYTICNDTATCHICIDKFNKDFADSFDKCDCDDFKSDYYRSITHYFFMLCGVFVFGGLELAFSTMYWCRARKMAASKAETKEESKAAIAVPTVTAGVSSLSISAITDNKASSDKGSPKSN